MSGTLTAPSMDAAGKRMWAVEGVINSRKATPFNAAIITPNDAQGIVDAARVLVDFLNEPEA